MQNYSTQGEIQVYFQHMEEIIIEGKKYIPSKQAAKLTGYAKDYVGQLCREGRVPARLVGRSWYVLESAIKDHRFGNQEKDTKEAKHTTKDQLPVKKDEVSVSDTWDSPQYEALEVETLPSLQKDFLEDVPEKKHNDLHSVWGEWFEHIAPNEPEDTELPKIDTMPVKENTMEEEPPLISETLIPTEIETPKLHKSDKRSSEKRATFVPLHLMKNTNAKIQHSQELRSIREESSPLTNYQMEKYTLYFQVIGIVLATTSVFIAILGSGYIDTYLISYNPVSNISGIVVYNK